VSACCVHSFLPVNRFILPALGLLACFAADLTAAPLKVFILAGQSNMEGHAKIETFDYIGDDPATAPMLRQMRSPEGKPAVADHVWISYLTGAGDNNGEGFGKLTAGYGSRQKPDTDGGKIGPEFTFGLTMDKALAEPVLIIKTAWGGKSLHTDFRPPSAGPYVPSAVEVKNKKFETQEEREKKIAATGRYYRLMIDHVKFVLKDIKRVVPSYEEKDGYELAGFVWLQGWNDMVDRNVYPDLPKGDARNRFAQYTDWLAAFIRDTRKDLGTPKLPFVIGVMGVHGAHPDASTIAFREAMAAPAALPEFAGNVTAVQTAPFYDEPLGAIFRKKAECRQKRYELDKRVKAGVLTKEAAETEAKAFEAALISPAEDALWKRGASNAEYHYLGCAKTFALMGRAFAEANLGMMKSSR
jgi:hypothetical protein